jgi:hypothetical protein
VADLTLLGVSTMPLFADNRETVWLEHWDANTTIDLLALQGLEVFVIQGSFRESGEEFLPYFWLRLPARSHLQAHAGAGGCQIWLKNIMGSAKNFSL